MEICWNSGGKKRQYEYKYRRSGKTLCALYESKNKSALMIIFGKAEREKFELERHSYSKDICQIYDAAETYRDGKWVMFDLCDISKLDEYKKLLAVKRKPNKKNLPSENTV